MEKSLFSLLLFFILTLITFIIRYYQTSASVIRVVYIVYFLLVFISQFFINLNITKDICQYYQPAVAFFTTILPWGLVFGSLNVLLLMFPGWKAPFSNTIGYLFAQVGGIRNVMNNILPSKISNNKMLEDIYENIVEDNSLLINEITPDNFNDFWSKMKAANLLSRNANMYKEKLYNLVKLKDLTSEFVWYFLTGTLISSITYNYISNIQCKRNAKVLKEEHAKWEKEKNQKLEVEDRKVYTIRD